MIIRKPYAFLIKNFKKIHIILLVISLYVSFKLLDIGRFVNDFMSLGVYDSFNDPITKHISFLLQISIILLFIGSFILLMLLRHKGKPWKMYLYTAIEYLVLLFILFMIKGFFNNYTNGVSIADLRLSRDLLIMALVGQLGTIGVYLMRVLGIDLGKFNFSNDQEFLELSEEDREEVEIRVRIDKNIFIRLFNRLVRNCKYFYLEHKLICKIALAIFVVVIGYSTYKYMFVTNKSYSEGDFYSANGYTIKINNSYFTDKDYRGNVVSKNSNFVIIDLNIKNNDSPRTIKLDNFHLKSGTSSFDETNKLYAKEFQDLGNTYDSVKELKRDEEVNFIIIFSVGKKIDKNSFVLFYQENDGNLRKIKLNINDISKIKNNSVLNLGDTFKIDTKNKKDTISFDKYEFLKTTSFRYRICNTTKCYTTKENYTAEEGYKVLKIDFSSIDFEGKDMVDFSIDYGKIDYIDNSKMEQSVEFKYPIKKKALGKYIYTLVPEAVEKSEKLEIVYIIRNEKYVYKLK